jgi:hypothetical protein
MQLLLLLLLYADLFYILFVGFVVSLYVLRVLPL